MISVNIASAKLKTIPLLCNSKTIVDLDLDPLFFVKRNDNGSYNNAMITDFEESCRSFSDYHRHLNEM